ncbi:hypothetical protein ACWGMA_40220 [Streptomyces asiaticus]
MLDNLPADDGKQRTIILGDLAVVEAAAGRPEEACRWANEALDQLSATWYAVGMDRIRDVRKRLHAWRDEPYVRSLDDRMYGWERRSALFSAEAGDQPRQLGEAVHAEGRHRDGFRVIPLDRGPRSAPDACRLWDELERIRNRQSADGGQRRGAELLPTHGSSELSGVVVTSYHKRLPGETPEGPIA